MMLILSLLHEPLEEAVILVGARDGVSIVNPGHDAVDETMSLQRGDEVIEEAIVHVAPRGSRVILTCSTPGSRT